MWTLGPPSCGVLSEAVCFHVLLFYSVVALNVLLASSLRTVSSLKALYSSIVEENVNKFKESDDASSQ